nr:hypothetical protein GCM10025730_49070 [Promicromonospora thailandica]
MPWNDASGVRLRGWLGVDDATFYDPDRIAILPMDFYYPGKGSPGTCRPARTSRTCGTGASSPSCRTCV